MLSVPSLEVNEGGQATYTVSLETQPSGNVSVAIAEADLSPGTERNATDSNITVTHTAAGADYDGVSANRRDSGGRANRKRPLRQDERFRRWTCRGNADTNRTPKRQVMRSIGSFRRLVFHELATTNTTEIGTAMLPLRRVTLPALTDASPSATPARLAHLSRNEPPPAPPPNPRTPESSPPSPGGSSSASNRRASRLLAGTALSRAGSAACYVAGAFLAALAVLLTLPLEAQAQTATMVLSPTSLDVPEAGSASYSVKLGTLPTAEVTVSIGGTSGTDLSLNMASLTFTTSNWDTAQMVTVSAAGDSDATHDMATLTHTASGGGYGSVSADLQVTVTDITRMRLVAVIETVTEGESKPIRARIPMPLDVDVSITVTVAPNGGRAGGRADEYELSANTTLTIAAGTMESTGTVEFTSLDDFTYTGTRYFNATLTPDHPRVDAGTERLTVVDDDNTISLLQVAPSRIFESGGTAMLLGAKVSLHEGVVKMEVSLEPSGRATLSGNTLTFPPGALYATETLTITAVDNTSDETDQVITISATVTEGRGIRTPAPVQLTIVDDEGMSPEVALVLRPPRVREGLSSTVTALASAPLDNEATITVSASPGHADTRTDDYALSADPVLTIPAGGTRSTGTVTIATVDDQFHVGSRRRVVTVSGTVTGGGGVSNPADQTLTVLEDDQLVPIAVIATPATIAEGGVSTITLRSLGGALPADVNVTIRESSDEVELSADPVLMIAEGETESTGTVTLTAVQDTDMRNGVITVFGDPDNAFVRVAPASVFTVDDDATEATLTVSPVPARFYEGETSTIIAALSRTLSDDVTVTIGVDEADVNHTATADDYTLSGDLTFTIPAGDMRGTGPTLTASNDEYFGPLAQRQVVLDIASVTGTGIDRVVKHSDWYIFEDEEQPRVTLAVTPASIAENNGQSTVTASLNTIVESDVEVTVTTEPAVAAQSDDFTQTGTLLTISAGQKTGTGTVTISAVDDDVDGPDKNLVVRGAVEVVGMEQSGLVWFPYDESLTIQDDDEPGLVLSKSSLGPAEGASESYTVALATQPTGQVTVTITGHSGTDLTLDETSLTFTTTNWSTAQTVTVTAGQDDDTADDEETLTHTASGGGYGSVAEDLPVTVDDDDEPVPGLVLSKSSLGPAEGASESYTVALATQPTGQVTVTITGHSGTDLTLGETSLTFTTTNWSTAQTVTVTAGQDDDTADDEETLTHTASGGGYGSVAEDLDVTVDDDDVPGLVLSKSSLGPAEGASESYTVALATQPTGQVTVTITGHSGTDLTLDETSLTFTTTNWSTAQTVTVTAGQDDDTADDEETLTHTASGGGYGSVAEDLDVTVDDDDVPGLVLSKSSLGPAEGASESYTVALATQPTGQVTVTITGHSGTDLTLDETSLTFTTTNWSTAQTVTVTAGQDDDTADDEETLTHTASGGGYGSVAEDLDVTVDDDDEPVPGLVLSKSSLGPAEGASESYTVALATQPTGQVTVTITGHSGTDLTLDETSLTFTTTNWSTAQTVTVTAGQDDDTADDEETLTHTASGGGYGSVAEDLPVTVDDDDTDTEPLVLTVEAVKDVVTEGEPVRYRILMSRPTSGAVVQSVYSYTGDFVHRRHRLSRVVTGVSSHGSRLYWERELETLDDAIDEEDGSFTVRIQKPDADLYDQGEEYTVGTPSSATVTILDNDPEDTPTVPLVSVFDASVDEGPDAVLAFPVRLNVAVVETATIEWETRDLSAKAGQDYKGASGTLVFSPGETVKTVRVEVIDDAQVEGTEVMLLLLTDVEGAVIDGELAVGTIKDNDAASDTAEDALALVDDLTPGVAAAVLLGEQTLGEAELAALDRLGNGNGRYDLGDLLSWIDRCRRGEAHCGRTSTDSGPAAAALLGGAAAGGRSTPRRPGRRDSGRRGRSSTGGIRHRARVAGYALAILLAATMTWSCTEGSVAPVAPRPDPGFLTVEWSGPATHRDVGVLLELEGPTIDAVRAPGLELYESSAPGPHQIVVAGVLRPGPLVQFRVPDRNQFALYRVRVLQVTGEDYGLRDVGEYQAVITVHR